MVKQGGKRRKKQNNIFIILSFLIFALFIAIILIFVNKNIDNSKKTYNKVISNIGVEANDNKTKNKDDNLPKEIAVNPDWFNPNDFASKSIYVYNLTDGKEIVSFNANQRLAPASLVKIMTCFVALDNVSDLDAEAPIDRQSYMEHVENNSSMAGFFGDENTTYRDLLYGTMLPSGGECAESLAINISADKEKYVWLMNKMANKLGLNDTHYTNVTGVDSDDQFTTAKDVTGLLVKALENKNFYEIFTTAEHTSFTNSHKEGLNLRSTVLGNLLNYKQDGFKIIGGKSGTTFEAGLCWSVLR